MSRYNPATDEVQPILVPRTGSHLATIHAVASASLAAFLISMEQGTQSPTWAEWLHHAPAKTVRRVKAASHLHQLRTWARDAGANHAVRPLPDGDVIALAPMPYADFPHRAAGAQVNGVDYPRTQAAPIGTPGPVRVAVLAEISTGKAAAQAAHALWHWAIPQFLDPGELRAWARAHMPFQVTTVAAAELADWARAPGASRVHDAGRTEVAPHTLTSVALPT